MSMKSMERKNTFFKSGVVAATASKAFDSGINTDGVSPASGCCIGLFLLGMEVCFFFDILNYLRINIKHKVSLRYTHTLHYWPDSEIGERTVFRSEPSHAWAGSNLVLSTTAQTFTNSFVKRDAIRRLKIHTSSGGFHNLQ